MIFKILFYAVAFGTMLLAVSRLATELHGRNKIFRVEDAPSSRVAIVFGAGLWRDGTPTAVLRDRIETAVHLYEAGKVQKLLMSGDNRQENYNEPASMKEYAVKLGVPENDIVLDYAGLRTYDTCYRAKEIFGLRDALLVTQRFHLPRAVFICNKLGIEAVGAIADQRQYSPSTYEYWNLRETIASLVAFWDIWSAKPPAILGDPEPIFPALQENSSIVSWEPGSALLERSEEPPGT